MLGARIVSRGGETDETMEFARACERAYWSVRSNCAGHRRREVRRAAVEACGALVTRVVLSRVDRARTTRSRIDGTSERG